MSRVVRWILLSLVRLFYRNIGVSGLQHLPMRGPAIVVANHPNGLLDPVVVRLATARPVHFLAKSTLFKSWLGRLAMSAFGGIPVFRARDGEDTGKNDRTFELCREHLARGGWIALFPEGTSHSDSSLKPLKTGAARIAMSAVAEGAVTGSLPIIPAGLYFEDKETFRSAAAVTLGSPIDVVAFVGEHGSDFAAAEALTARLHEALSSVLLEADNEELWRSLLLVAAWTDPAARDDLRTRQERARRLESAWRELVASQPEKSDEIVLAIRAFTLELKSIGVEDPLGLEAPPAPSASGIWWLVAPVVLLAPVAALGVVLGWLPYRLVRSIAVRLAGEHRDLVGTIKLLAGLLFIGVWYLAGAIGMGWWLGWATGFAALLVGPLSGLVALRFGERVALRRSVLGSVWLRATADQRALAIVERRRAIARWVADALGE